MQSHCCYLAGSLRQRAQVAAAGGKLGGGAGAVGDHGGAVGGDLWGLQCAGGGV